MNKFKDGWINLWYHLAILSYSLLSAISLSLDHGDSKNTVQTLQLLLLVNGKQLADLCEKSVSLVFGNPPETDGFVCLWEKLLTSKRKASLIYPL